MQIQWYPGHMHKAQKEIKEILPNVDLIIEVLDARLPFSSENPMIASLRGDKPCVKILNKSDLADPVITAQWQLYLEQEKNVKTLALSIEKADKLKQLSTLCRKLVPNKGDNVRSLNCLIMGIPNVGKSTLINALAERAIAKTGNEPAVTKTQQRINLRNGIILIDTPGLLWSNVENKNSGYRLAVTGAIKDTAVVYADIADFAAELLLEFYPENIKMRYQIEALPYRSYELLELIGKKRGCLSGGGHIDFDKTGKLFIGEIRSGALGRITLETPEMMEKELAELAIIREEKAAKKAARKVRFKKSRKR
ncbi:MAG: ribosome biogenesis GTPase YlqF [Gammaproteobacteria bacterium]|nr:MAG: ribosome biogenesis GTPase YlqF [Gammaproteobacteria bacterium]RLA23443.1 MAG: ribosome biogenesis GTPase YlqF [Gammaproteobacteria bacterium]